MGATRITWTPISHGTGTRTLDLGTHPTLFRHRGGIRGNVRRTISVGSKAVTRTLETWHEYDIVVKNLGPDVDAAQFNLLHAWWSHAIQGGEFTFAVDSDDVADTLLDGAVSAGDTAITLDSTSGMEDGDWLYFESATSSLFWERIKIDTVDTGTTLTLADGLTYDYPDNSIVRHAEYLPACICLDDEQPFTERDAGKGLSKWDLDMTVRAVR